MLESQRVFQNHQASVRCYTPSDTAWGAKTSPQSWGPISVQFFLMFFDLIFGERNQLKSKEKHMLIFFTPAFLDRFFWRQIPAANAAGRPGPWWKFEATNLDPETSDKLTSDTDLFDTPIPLCSTRKRCTPKDSKFVSQNYDLYALPWSQQRLLCFQGIPRLQGPCKATQDNQGVACTQVDEEARTGDLRTEPQWPTDTKSGMSYPSGKNTFQ